MSSNPNVTTPGGFFVGLGGIVSFCVVAAVVLIWVKKPRANDELRPQQVALGLRAADDAKIEDLKKKEADTAELLSAAANRYNGGVQPNLDKLDELRGVVRYREALKTSAEAAKAVTGAPAWKDKAKGDVTMPVDLAMNIVAKGLKDRKPKASAVKVDMMPTLDPNAAPMLPNAMGGGARTVIFADPNVVSAPASVPSPVPAAAPAPAPAVPAPAAPAPASPPLAQANPPPAKGASNAVTVPIAVAKAGAPAPSRPTLLNWPESKK